MDNTKSKPECKLCTLGDNDVDSLTVKSIPLWYRMWGRLCTCKAQSILKTSLPSQFCCKPTIALKK